MAQNHISSGHADEEPYLIILDGKLWEFSQFGTGKCIKTQNIISITESSKVKFNNKLGKQCCVSSKMLEIEVNEANTEKQPILDKIKCEIGKVEQLKILLKDLLLKLEEKDRYLKSKESQLLSSFGLRSSIEFCLSLDEDCDPIDPCSQMPQNYESEAINLKSNFSSSDNSHSSDLSMPSLSSHNPPLGSEKIDRSAYADLKLCSSHNFPIVKLDHLSASLLSEYNLNEYILNGMMKRKNPDNSESLNKRTKKSYRESTSFLEFPKRGRSLPSETSMKMKPKKIFTKSLQKSHVSLDSSKKGVLTSLEKKKQTFPDEFPKKYPSEEAAKAKGLGGSKKSAMKTVTLKISKSSTKNMPHSIEKISKSKTSERATPSPKIKKKSISTTSVEKTPSPKKVSRSSSKASPQKTPSSEKIKKSTSKASPKKVPSSEKVKKSKSKTAEKTPPKKMLKSPKKASLPKKSPSKSSPETESLVVLYKLSSGHSSLMKKKKESTVKDVKKKVDMDQKSLKSNKRKFDFSKKTPPKMIKLMSKTSSGNLSSQKNTTKSALKGTLNKKAPRALGKSLSEKVAKKKKSSNKPSLHRSLKSDSLKQTSKTPMTSPSKSSKTPGKKTAATPKRTLIITSSLWNKRDSTSSDMEILNSADCGSNLASSSRTDSISSSMPSDAEASSSNCAEVSLEKMESENSSGGTSALETILSSTSSSAVGFETPITTSSGFSSIYMSPVKEDETTLNRLYKDCFLLED